MEWDEEKKELGALVRVLRRAVVLASVMTAILRSFVAAMAMSFRSCWFPGCSCLFYDVGFIFSACKTVCTNDLSSSAKNYVHVP